MNEANAKNIFREAYNIYDDYKGITTRGSQKAEAELFYRRCQNLANWGRDAAEKELALGFSVSLCKWFDAILTEDELSKLPKRSGML